MHILAAGSLKRVWPLLMAEYPHADAISTVRFGPAGLLCEAILAGERCDLFASANLAHPQRLLAAGLATRVIPFTANSLCLTARADVVQPGDDWLTLLRRTGLRLATSTAGCDPSGDYTQTLFQRIGQQDSQLGEQLRQRAMPLVGGRDSPPVPDNRLAASWLLNTDRAELFIGYASYAPQLRQDPSLQVFDIPAICNPQALYALAILTPPAGALANFLTSSTAQSILADAGFAPVPVTGNADWQWMARLTGHPLPSQTKLRRLPLPFYSHVCPRSHLYNPLHADTNHSRKPLSDLHILTLPAPRWAAK